MNRPGEREQDEDRRLGLGPQSGGGDDRGRRQQEDPDDDPDDAVVGPGGDAVIGDRSIDAADDRGLGCTPLGVDAGRDVAARVGLDRPNIGGTRMIAMTARFAATMAMNRIRTGATGNSSSSQAVGRGQLEPSHRSAS